jgi:hypothetical protein
LLLRLEDLVLAGWVAVASPLLFRTQGSPSGPFDSGRPVDGLVRLAAVLAALVCIAARRRPATSGETRVSNQAATGPLAGGLLLVAISGFVALDISQSAIVLSLVGATGALMLAVHLWVPPLPTPVRRVLVSPFVLVTGGIFWNVIEEVTGPGFPKLGPTALDPRAVPVALLFLAAFSAVYYAMLIYAPRQVAEQEGGVVAWLLRYAAFLVSIVLGLGWLRVLGA